MVNAVPPPEAVDAARKRSWIIYSFWAVIVFLGLPTWWQTTSIPRTALPLDDMLTWSQKPETRPFYTVPIRVAAPEMPCEIASKLLRETEKLLNEKTSSWGFEAHLNLVRFTSGAGTGQQVGGQSCNVEEVSPDYSTTSVDIELRPGATFDLDFSSSTTPMAATYDSTQPDALAPNLAEAIQRALVDEQAAVAYQYYSQGRTEAGLFDFMNNLPGNIMKQVQDSAARAFKSSPNYYVTFSLFTPGGFPSSWAIEAALDQHIQPLLHVLSASANYSVTTQIQLYSTFSLSIEPYQEEGIRGWFLRKSDLTAFANTAEWPLSPSVGSGPTINFVLYVPSKNQTPLRVEGKIDDEVLGGSWIVPQWGGITILNAPIVRNDPEVNREDVIASLDVDLLKPAFEVFQSQLLSLLGVSPSSSMSLPLRLKAFQRLSALSLHLRTSSNLSSLARLAQHLNNIPIPRHVSQLVSFAMDSLRSYRNDPHQARKGITANEGYKASEKAFFDKSMVGQVYFPDEHKVAVYLPLLGPIGVPLLLSLIRELRLLRARLRS